MKTADPTLLNDSDFSAQVTPERVIEPATQWRNKWKKVGTSRVKWMYVGGISRTITDGSVYWAPVLHPTREIAEARAMRAIELDVADGLEPNVWLGAFPIEGDA